ncbi:unnamed protein product [Penicillium camemberti]|uniref:Str. FM013 n=1 Tax=Penicillium camemberti (strain FM 013) TaxID=1429867 RepID=A0A0G4PAG6_PENC3|nr:unnamed protein product [Penicillium camemberti]
MSASAQSPVMPGVDGIRIVSKAAVVQLCKSFGMKSAQRANSVAMYLGTVDTDFTKEFWNGRDWIRLMRDR